MNYLNQTNQNGTVKETGYENQTTINKVIKDETIPETAQGSVSEKEKNPEM
mgnify:CR=1 FL=1